MLKKAARSACPARLNTIMDYVGDKEGSRASFYNAADMRGRMRPAISAVFLFSGQHKTDQFPFRPKDTLTFIKTGIQFFLRLRSYDPDIGRHKTQIQKDQEVSL